MNEEYLEKRMCELESETIPVSNTKYELLPLSGLMSRQFPPNSWVIDKLVPSEGITAISGAPASYKTWLILMLAIEVARGGSLFGQFQAKQCGVLIIDEENGERLLQQRLKELELIEGLPIYFLSYNGFKLNDSSVENIIELIGEKQIGLVIFDSLIRIHSGDENDASQMSKTFLYLKQFNKNGITVIVTHHHRKQKQFGSSPSQEMRGSSDILASLDCHIAVERNDEEVTIHQPKLRQDEEQKPFKLKFSRDENGLFFFLYEGEADDFKKKIDQCKEAVLELLKENGKLFQKEIFELLKTSGLAIGEKTLRTALDDLVENELLNKAKGEKNKTYYSLSQLDDSG